MKTDENLFAHEVQIGRPPAFPGRIVRPTGCGKVVDQRVEPDIDHFRWIVRNGDAPSMVVASDAHIPQALANESDHLITTELRKQEVRVLLDVGQEAVAEG